MDRGRSVNRLLTVMLFAGLALLLYPPLSSYWNALHQSRAIAGYIEQTSRMDEARYEALLDDARAYNASLAAREGGFVLTERERDEFYTQLDAGGGAVGYLEIPAISLRLPIFLGTSESVLQSGAGVLEGSSLPVGGTGTHTVLTGHRGLPTATLFTHLDRLTAGDRVMIHVLDETLSYEVTGCQIVEPYEMDALKIQPEEDLCTLVTCTPYGVNTQRMLIQARRTISEDGTEALRVSADALLVRRETEAAALSALLLAAAFGCMLLTGVVQNGKKKGECQ